MSDALSPNPAPHCEDFDYSAPEAQKAMQGITSLILEIRKERGPVARKIALYERTLGLAVIPVLVRRALIVAGRRMSQRRRGA